LLFDKLYFLEVELGLGKLGELAHALRYCSVLLRNVFALYVQKACVHPLCDK